MPCVLTPNLAQIPVQTWQNTEQVLDVSLRTVTFSVQKGLGKVLKFSFHVLMATLINIMDNIACPLFHRRSDPSCQE